MRFLTPAEIVNLAEAIHARHRALMFVGAYGGLRMGPLTELRQSRVDLRVGTVTVAETLTQAKGRPIAGPPKTRAGRRTVGLPPFVVHELEAHPAAAQRPGSHVFTAPGGGAPRVPGFRARSWVPATKQPACISMIFTTPPWRCGSPPTGRPRRSPCPRGTSVSLTLDRYGHQPIPSRSRRAGAIQ